MSDYNEDYVILDLDDPEIISILNSSQDQNNIVSSFAIDFVCMVLFICKFIFYSYRNTIAISLLLKSYPQETINMIH